jgi:hypothetical protein
LPNLSKTAARLHAKKFKKPWKGLSEGDLTDFYELKKQLLDREALSTPNFANLDKYAFIVGLDWSKDGLRCTLSQVQLCANSEYRRRLIFTAGRKTGPAGHNYSSHRGDLSALLHATHTWKYILSHRHFLVETDSLSVKYCQTLKNLSGCFMRWANQLSKFNFSVTHAAVPVENAISRCPAVLPEPTEEEMGRERHYEEGPHPRDIPEAPTVIATSEREEIIFAMDRLNL